ncbi:hypothetical protein [Rhodoglobus sp.]
MRNTLPSITTAAALAILLVSLAGCSAISDTLHNESTSEFASASDLVKDWDTKALWVPENAQEIRIRESTPGDAAILRATTDSKLDPQLCVEVERQSAATFDADWAPDSYVDKVFACGDWAVIPADGGWFGWTPNHPDEKSAAEAITP